MSQVVDSQRVKDILRFIEDKDAFILELLAAVNLAITENNPKIVEDCLDSWEESAELNSIPGFSKKIKERYDSLVKAGLINAE